MTILCLIVAALVPTGRQDLDSEEKAFVAQCIDKMLNGKSEKVRRGAEDALVAIGVPVIDELSAKSGDGAWNALENICARIGSQASADRLAGLANSTKDATRKSKLTALAAKLRSAVPGAASNPELAGKVNALLAPLRTATSFSTSDPVIDKLVDLGHDAVPILVSHLKPFDRGGMSGSAIEAALKKMVEAGDLPLLRESLLRGSEQVAAAIAKLLSDGTPGALKALHEAVERGVFGWGVAGALEGSPEPADTARVVSAWFKTHPAAPEHVIASGAQLLGKLGVFDSAETLHPWIQKAKDQQTVYHLGNALTLLGDTKGIPLLIRVVGNEGFAESIHTGWNRPYAARLLNEVSGKSLEVAEERINGRVTGEQEQKFAAAAKEFRSWWDGAKGRLKFDRSTRQWAEK
ncbi:MAG TPA: hypothetical protein VJU16_01845 [Planctomycetota bacterium]|nr:hypothetical protein [Planctomycetota bacterium]